MQEEPNKNPDKNALYMSVHVSFAFYLFMRLFVFAKNKTILLALH